MSGRAGRNEPPGGAMDSGPMEVSLAICHPVLRWAGAEHNELRESGQPHALAALASAAVELPPERRAGVNLNRGGPAPARSGNSVDIAVEFD